MKPTPAVLATLTEKERSLFGVSVEEEVKTILQKACDRSWEDETLYQTANIVSNAIYWRDREIATLKGRIIALEMALEKVDALGNGLSMQEDEQGLTSYVTLMRCGSIARAALLASGGDK